MYQIILHQCQVHNIQKFQLFWLVIKCVMIKNINYLFFRNFTYFSGRFLTVTFEVLNISKDEQYTKRTTTATRKWVRAQKLKHF